MSVRGADLLTCRQHRCLLPAGQGAGSHCGAAQLAIVHAKFTPVSVFVMDTFHVVVTILQARTLQVWPFPGGHRPLGCLNDGPGGCRFLRVGSVIMVLHDVSDILLECAKMFNYCHKDTIADILFGLFMLSWALLRLVYFPGWVIWSTS